MLKVWGRRSSFNIWCFYRTPEDKRNWPAINAALAQCAKDFA